jgi:PAS domain S-box-containing protein
MSTRQQLASDSQISNPLVQTSLLGEAVENAQLAILVSDEEGHCIAVNKHACALLGYTRAELLELDVPEFAPGTDPRACHREVHASGLSDGVTDAIRSDGTTVSIRYWSTPTRVAQMRLVLSVGQPESMAAA